MHPNQELLKRFYTAFQKRDHAGMAACYHPEIEFSDPVFKDLKGFKAGAMWHMLCERGKDLVIEFSDLSADDTTGRAHWEAHYTFSVTGQKVHNRIDASFEFKDGKIIRHTDDFNLTAWAGMALGLKGQLLGWAPPVQNAIRKNTLGGLDQFIARNNLS